jgi:hypothetical protein
MAVSQAVNRGLLEYVPNLQAMTSKGESGSVSIAALQSVVGRQAE